MTLSWAANAEADLASYRVVRDLVEIATVTPSTGYVDLGLTNDTDYAYTVVAVDTHGNRSVSSGAGHRDPHRPGCAGDTGGPEPPRGATGR